VALGIKNVFNTDPPYTNAGGQNVFQAGYDPGYADPRGRFIHGSVTYTFK
jgi:iron complex outermembrane receptor protein